MNREQVLLTSREIETRLERGLVGKTLTYAELNVANVTGKLQRLSVTAKNGELIVCFQVNTLKYETILEYFIKNTTIHYGSHDSGDNPDVRGILKKHR